MTGNIIANGTEAFTPAVDKLGVIATEFLPYILYIALACAGIMLCYQAVKYIIHYLTIKNRNAFYVQRFEGGERKNGVFHARFRRVKRKKPKRKYFKYFR